jgi:hypothetical protein
MSRALTEVTISSRRGSPTQGHAVPACAAERRRPGALAADDATWTLFGRENGTTTAS